MVDALLGAGLGVSHRDHNMIPSVTLDDVMFDLRLVVPKPNAETLMH